MDFHLLNRKQLQELCKKHGIPANLKNVQMAHCLSSLLLKEEKPEKAGRKGRSCLKRMSEVVEVGVDEKIVITDGKEVKKVRFSPENQTFLFERTDPRAIRLLARKKRAFGKLREEENPDGISVDLVEAHSLVEVSDDVARVQQPVGGRNVRRKSLMIPEGVGLVGQNDDNVEKLGVNGGNLGQNLRSRRGKGKLDGQEMMSLVSPSCVDKVENALKGRNLERSSRSAVQGEDLGLMSQDVGKWAVKGQNLERNLRSRKGKAKQESPEMISLLSPSGVKKVENVVKGRNLKKSMVQTEDLGMGCEHVDEGKKLPVKRRNMDMNLRSRDANTNQASLEMISLSSRVIDKVKNVVKGQNLRSSMAQVEELDLLSINVDEEKKLPVKRGRVDRSLRTQKANADQEIVDSVEKLVAAQNSKRSLRSREENANEETAEMVTLLSPKPVEGGNLKRSLRSQGGKKNDNGAGVVPLTSPCAENKMRKGRKGKITVEEGDDVGFGHGGNPGRVARRQLRNGEVACENLRGDYVLECKNPKKRGRGRKIVGLGEKVKAISQTSNSKEEDYDKPLNEDVASLSGSSLKTISENKGRRRGRRKTLILKGQNIKEEDIAKQPDVSERDERCQVTEDPILIEHTANNSDEATCQTSPSSLKQPDVCKEEVIVKGSENEEVNVRVPTPSLLQKCGSSEDNKVQECPESDSKHENGTSLCLMSASNCVGESGVTMTETSDTIHSGEKTRSEECLGLSTNEDLMGNKINVANNEVDYKMVAEYLSTEDIVLGNPTPASSLPKSRKLEIEEHHHGSRDPYSVEQKEECFSEGTPVVEFGEEKSSVKEVVECAEPDVRTLANKDASSPSSLPSIDDKAYNVQEIPFDSFAVAGNSTSKLLEHTDNCKDFECLSDKQERSCYSEQMADNNGLEIIESTAVCSLSERREPELAVLEPYLATEESVETEQSLKKNEEATQLSPSSSVQLNLAHETTQSNECREVNGINETTSEKADLKSPVPAKYYVSTPLMENSDNVPSLGSTEGQYCKSNIEHLDKASNSRTSESCLKHLFSEDVMLNTDETHESKGINSEKDYVGSDLQDMRSISEVVENKVEASLSEQVVNDSEPQNMYKIDANNEKLAVELVNESSDDSKGSNKKIKESKCTKEFASDDSTAEFSPSVTKVDSGAYQVEETPFELLAAADYTFHEKYATPSASKDILSLRSLNSEYENSTFEQVEQTDNCNDFEHLSHQQEMSCFCEQTKDGNKREITDFTAACSLSVSEEVELAEPCHDIVSVQKEQSVEEIEEVTQFSSSGLNLAHETTQLMEFCEENDSNETIPEKAELTSPTTSKYNVSMPSFMQKSDKILSLRSKKGQDYKSTIKQLEQRSNDRTFESSLKHLFSEDNILTDENKGVMSENDDVAEDLQDMRSIREVIENNVGAPPSEQLADYDEHQSMYTIDANDAHIAVESANEGSDDKEESCMDGSTAESSPSPRKEPVLVEHYHETGDCIQFEHKEEICEETIQLSPKGTAEISSEAMGYLEKFSARSKVNSNTSSENDRAQPSVVQTNDNGDEVQEMPLEILDVNDSNIPEEDDFTPAIIVRGAENKTSFSSIADENPVAEKDDDARSMTECGSLSRESDGGKQIKEFSPIEKVVVACEGSDVGIIQLPSTERELKDMETVTPLQDEVSDLRSENPLPESDLSVETSFFRRLKVVGEHNFISASMEKGEETQNEATKGNITCSKSSSKVDCLTLLDRLTFKQAEEANNFTPPNVQPLVSKDLFMNFDEERGLECEKVLRVAEHNLPGVGEDQGKSGSSLNMISADLNSFITEVMPRDDGEMFQARDSISYMPQEEINDMFNDLLDNYIPQTSNKLKHDEENGGELVEFQAHKLIDRDSAVVMHQDVALEAFLNDMNDSITDHSPGEFSRGKDVQGNCVAGIAENAVLATGISGSFGRIVKEACEIEEYPNGGSENLKDVVADHETEVLEDANGNKLSAEPNCNIAADSRVTQQNGNENQVEDQTRTVQVDACNVEDCQLALESTEDLENLPHDTREASNDDAYILYKKLLNSEARNQNDGNQGSTQLRQGIIYQESAADSHLDFTPEDVAISGHDVVLERTDTPRASPHVEIGLDLANNRFFEATTADTEEPNHSTDTNVGSDLDEKDNTDAQNVDATVDEDDNLKFKRRNRIVLLHGTPMKTLLPNHDMKENMGAPKRSQIINATATKPMVKRKVLGDVRH